MTMMCNINVQWLVTVMTQYSGLWQSVSPCAGSRKRATVWTVWGSLPGHWVDKHWDTLIDVLYTA